jgi:uncharacterized protein (DUF2267 family)
METLNFQKHEQQATAFLKEVAAALETPEDLAHAERILTAVLHTLRDRLTPQESLDLISQLPLYIKALFIEGWNIPEKVKRLKSPEEFFDEVRKQAPRTAGRDFGSDESTQKKVEAVFHVLHQHISEGEINDVKAQLPNPIAELLEA